MHPASPPTADPLAHALAYAGLGLRVIPIKPDDKRPPMGAWQNAAATDRNTIESWWTGLYRGHGVGLALGELDDYSTATTYVFAVDVDMHGIDGEQALRDTIAHHGSLPDTWEALTGGGGRHLLFSSPVEIRNGKLAPGVDIRGAGGQIVVEPSIHPSGRPYAWEAGHAPWEHPLAHAPAWLIDQLTRPEPAPSEPRQPASDAGDRPGDLWAAQTTWRDLLEGDGWTWAGRGPAGEDRWTRPGKQVRDGISATTGYTPNDNLKVFTSSVTGLEADSVYSKLGYLAATRHHGDHAAAARTLAADGWHTPAVDPASLIAGPNAAEGSAGDDRGGNPLLSSLVNWPELWTMEQQPEWLLEPLFARSRAHVLYAGAKTGKSYVVLAAVAALATGQPFLEHPGGDPVNVLYVDYEMTPEDVRDRLEEFGYGPDSDLGHLHYAVLPIIAPLDTAEGGAYLLDAAQRVGAEFVVIDTTSRAVEGEENDSSTIRAFYRHTGVLLKKAGIGWIRLDHAGKDLDRGQRGSSAKNDDVDVVWRLKRTDGGHEFEATHRRMSWVPEKVSIVTSEEDGTTAFRLQGGVSWPAGTRDLAAQLDDLGVPTEMGARRIRVEYPSVVATNAVLRAAIRWRKQAVDNLVSDGTKDHVEARRKSSGAAVIHTAPEPARRGGENPEEMGSARSSARSAPPSAAGRRTSAPRSGARSPAHPDWI